MNRITGQLIVRDVADPAPDGSDRHLAMVFGMLAIPKDSFLKGEHQYTVSGLAGGSLATMTIHEPGIDMSAVTLGNSPSGILCEPIWRI